MTGIRTIELTQGHVAIVDAADFHSLNQWRWKVLKAGRQFYACRTDGKSNATILMHREIAKAVKGVLVDHKNGNGLDNRRRNLRICSQSQNQGNSYRPRGKSRFKGVSWCKDKGKWQAQIGSRRSKNGRVSHLGRFDSDIEAAKAYDVAAIKLFGEFAQVNFPSGKRRSA